MYLEGSKLQEQGRELFWQLIERNRPIALHGGPPCGTSSREGFSAQNLSEAGELCRRGVFNRAPESQTGSLF